MCRGIVDNLKLIFFVEKARCSQVTTRRGWHKSLTFTCWLSTTWYDALSAQAHFVTIAQINLASDVAVPARLLAEESAYFWDKTTTLLCTTT